MSPKKKRSKLVVENSNILKRPSEHISSSNKRSKTEMNQEEDQIKNVQALKRKNFVTACKLVSYKAYFDYRTRMQLVYMPVCLDVESCRHHDYKNGTYIKQIPSYAEESFNIEIKTHMWCEALEVCRICVTDNQYLSANVLKNVVEIMLNAHEDAYAGYTLKFLMDKCQQILYQNFSTHPPCIMKSLRKCYNSFLTSPLDSKDNTFTNRKMFGCDKGLVKYCMNRLEYEISAESEDKPLVDRYENIPVEMKQSVKGLHWQKEKFEIFELLERPERIRRLMTVLESIIELLQFDLAIWHSRYTNNMGCHIMRSHKPLMAFILWSDNVLYTGAVNNNCRQIIRLFINIIHLKFPEADIKIISAWLNIMIQTFYICESNSNSDYPNYGKYCTAFAQEFFKIISDMPPDTVLKTLERIQPNYMRHLIGILYIRSCHSSKEDDIIKILFEFVEKSAWETFPKCDTDIELMKNSIFSSKKVNNITKYLSKRCKSWRKSHIISTQSSIDINYFKLDNSTSFSKPDQNATIHALYITLEAFLDAFNVQKVQETIDHLNEILIQKNEENILDMTSYSVSEQFVKKYRSIYQLLKELMLLLLEKKNSGQLPSNFKIFERIGLLGL